MHPWAETILCQLDIPPFIPTDSIRLPRTRKAVFGFISVTAPLHSQHCGSEKLVLRCVSPPFHPPSLLTEIDSRVFVSKEHRPKLRKKFGGVVKSPETNIHGILRVSKADVTRWIEKQLW